MHKLYQIYGLTAKEVENLINADSLKTTNRTIEVQPRLFEDKYDVTLVEYDRHEDQTDAPIRAQVIAKYEQISLFRGKDATK